MHFNCSFHHREVDVYKRQEAKHIVKLNSDFLIVGMGALMQEKFLLKVKNAGYQGVGPETKWVESSNYVDAVSYTHLDVYKRQEPY